MPSLTAFNRLDPNVQRSLRYRVQFRMERYLALKRGTWRPMSGEILLIGDRPAPSAPDDRTFHYTPFGALWNSSLWLNLQLERYAIDEQQLAWVNAYDLHGEPSDHQILDARWSQIIALGGNAERWFRRHPVNTPFSRHTHPQAWKRFHSADPYPLMQALSIGTC